jgi:L-2-hydroxyglutarate oxidase
VKPKFDFCVIGGGIVGLATAFRLHQRFRDASIVLLEKENGPGQHQSGRNSGVLHSGIYYVPGSLKATTCRLGKQQMEEFCSDNDIPFERCGKVIVATNEEELPRLEKLRDRGIANGVNCRRIDTQELADLEPAVRGVGAIHVAETGIVDYPGVCRRLVELLTTAGHSIRFGWRVSNITRTEDGVRLDSTKETVEARCVVNCAGLYSDHVMRLAGDPPPARIVPFRGEYYELTTDAEKLCRNLIYPVPDPAFPFLGVHFTRMIHGGVECGPNAVLALAREGYDWKTVRATELLESLGYRGFQKLAARHWRMGLGEIHRSLSKSAFLKALRNLIPTLKASHLKPCRAGVRAQAIKSDGTMVDDFLICARDRIVHVCNAPSPAATASLEIGNHICTAVGDHLLRAGVSL